MPDGARSGRNVALNEAESDLMVCLIVKELSVCSVNVCIWSVWQCPLDWIED